DSRDVGRHDHQPELIGVGGQGESQLHHHLVQVVVGRLDLLFRTQGRVDSLDGFDVVGEHRLTDHRVVGGAVDRVGGHTAGELLHVPDTAEEHVELASEETVGV